MKLENPVIPGTHPDPSVCRAGEDYYLAVSSFEYVPGVPLFHSTDLVTWERIGHCLTRTSQLDLESRSSSSGIFAPTLRYHDGTFYMVTTDVGGNGHFFVTADDPAGEWSDPTYIDAGGIDPDIFFDDDTVYVHYTDGETLTDFRIRQARIDLETGELDEPHQIWAGERGGFAEAPHLYEIDGTYYLLAAEGGTHTNHMITVGRSDTVTGPFERCPDNPILTHHGLVAHPIQATGHGDLVRAHDGSWWLMFLAIRQHGGHPGWHHLGRETYLAPVEWEHGWPVVNNGEPIDPVMEIDSIPGDPPFGPSDPGREFRDDFDDAELADGWFYRRTPDPNRYSLEDRESYLTLIGGTESLDEPRATFICRPQAHVDCVMRIDVTFDPDPGEEAGLALVTNESHHYEIGILGGENDPIVVVRLRIGDSVDVISRERVQGLEHQLGIAATADTYTFTSGSPQHELASAATRYLATEVAGGFTGVYCGPYALSNGTADVTPAYVDMFSYQLEDAQ